MERKHPAHADLYTPHTPELKALFDQMKLELGTWRAVCLVSGTRLKVFRAIRNGNRKAISMRMLDRLITTTGVGSLEDFVWFTADDLVALGIWKPVTYLKGGKPRRVGPSKAKLKRRAKKKREKAEARARARRIAKFRRGEMPWE
jgi:hypothetical protein